MANYEVNSVGRPSAKVYKNTLQSSRPMPQVECLEVNEPSSDSEMGDVDERVEVRQSEMSSGSDCR